MQPGSTDSTFDLIVIGAGINGAAIAREAALGGIKVLLVERGDIGAGTSSASSRLIHGGLRYLEHVELGLVHESLRERERLLTLRAAPRRAARALHSGLPRRAAQTLADRRRFGALRSAVGGQVAAESAVVRRARSCSRTCRA